MRFLDASSYTAETPWGALDVAEIATATVRLHWTDRPYRWHVNDGPEVVVVLDGAVEMHYRHDEQEKDGSACPRGADPGGRARRERVVPIMLPTAPTIAPPC